MIRSTLVPFRSQTRTFSPRLASCLANLVEKAAATIAKRHADTTTQSDLALAACADNSETVKYLGSLSPVPVQDERPPVYMGMVRRLRSGGYYPDWRERLKT